MVRISHSEFDSSASSSFRITFRFNMVRLEGSGLDSSRLESSWSRTKPSIGCGVSTISVLHTNTMTMLIVDINWRSFTEKVSWRGTPRIGLPPCGAGLWEGYPSHIPRSLSKSIYEQREKKYVSKRLYQHTLYQIDLLVSNTKYPSHPGLPAVTCLYHTVTLV